MLMPVEQRKAELLEAVQALVRERLASGLADQVEHFVGRLFRLVAPDDLEGREPEELYGAALSLWHFQAQRKPGEIKIRVFNPEYYEHGWDSRHTVVELVNDDRPFLVDSTTAELNRHNAGVHMIVHPVLRVERDESGKRTHFPDQATPPDSALAESVMHIQIDEITDPQALQQLEDDLRRVHEDVYNAVHDWRPMRNKLHEVVDAVDRHPPQTLDDDTLKEGKAFLQWLEDKNFTFLGYRAMSFSGRGKDAKLQPVPKSGMGVLRDDTVEVYEGMGAGEVLPPQVRQFLSQPDLLIVTKANRRSTVHRPVHMDIVAVKTFDKNGEVNGQHLFIGLLTSVAYARSVQAIPLLRRKFHNVMNRAGFAEDSHAGKALTNVLEQYPRDELFQIDEEKLFHTALGIVHLQDRQRISLFVRHDPFERFVSCLVYSPRDRYGPKLRDTFADILCRAYNGTVVHFNAKLDDDAHVARVHFIIKTEPGEVPNVETKEVEQSLREGARTWNDKLREALVDQFGEERGITLTRRYGDAFPAGFQERFVPASAVHDVELLEDARYSEGLKLNLYRPIESEEHQARFKIYRSGTAVPLSDILPILEHMGMRVVGEIPYNVKPADAAQDEELWVNDFELESQDDTPIDLTRVRANFQEAFARIWTGAMEDDGLNALIVRAGLHWREVMVLRAYAKFLRQARIPYSQSYIEETLNHHPKIAAGLVNLFETMFAPHLSGDREKQVAEAAEAVTDQFVDVEHLEEDIILRRFLNALQSSLRTNYYQTDPQGGPKTYLAIKFNSQNLEDLPLPRPMVEVFVFSPRVEATHLRGGKVARGGLRWSDRREDFRTEILGLLKAQMVKNALIVPVGSKGGFFVKRPPTGGDRKAVQAEGIECYKIFMAGLLDITDNLKGDEVVPPPQVVRRDRELLGDDPYLVVAADKGTATFSDIANSVSQSYGFWLDDAFASGGKDGYDHKVMGITARGAWESVKRHFRELGKNTQREPFTAAGVGDMAGDVFGNGMLLSDQIKLQAAFNHIHIFIDPDPDPATSYQERKRLFDEVKPWTEYSTKAMSKGGAVFERRSKYVTLTAEIKKLLGLKKDQITPNELIRAILQMKVELLWFGGIGTYIKASGESNADVGDKANDSIRVDAEELGCRVIGEGANLGTTQAARIAFARNGGKVNTDAIDNSGGVDCSDHEVNIKILLGKIVEDGDMTLKQRNELIQSMSEEVAQLVLRSNYLQPQAISVANWQAGFLLDQHARFMRGLEKDGRLSRPIEILPDEETIAERQQRNEGLTRPELSVLLAYGKMVLYEAMLGSDLPDEGFLNEELLRYFPTQVRDQYRSQIESHRLRRELIATQVTNTVVNRTGPSFVYMLRQSTGIPLPDITRAFLVVRNAFDLAPLWREIEALDNKVRAETQIALLAEIDNLVERVTAWVLRYCKRPFDVPNLVDQFGQGVNALSESLDTCLTKSGRDAQAKRAKRWTDQGVPDGLATKIAQLAALGASFDLTRMTQILESHHGKQIGVVEAGRVHWALGERLDIDWLCRAAQSLVPENPWQKQAREAIVEDLQALQSDLTLRVLAETGAKQSVDQGLKSWLKTQEDPIGRVDQLVGELKALPSIELSMLAVANRQLRGLVTA